MQECIDFFNDLEGIETEVPGLGDVLLESKEAFSDKLLELEEDDREVYVKAIQVHLIEFELVKSEQRKKRK